ncbi:LacI family DNA-binding transcriptional regulator [Exilibacterium tricleocarpae]|uniref:LacI family DNA-binding transcriptional regulator n=1 Tax=Exilibacterium tricleocarpae TaxID=2591008 RepID=A0A545TAL2_9GAMM|nr:LacI family DNA-binding transcriptional regulator [Exilibacterium tricleocarpae]TQV74262.1 LacI family DNA-binding transcriptional regulator [Exilibacterium tricleocarpae]
MRTKSRNLTLKDMAEHLCVSTATVSNAFNCPSQLSKELREHILAECRALGYLGPNAAARSLRTGRTGIIGVTLSNYLSYTFTDPVANQFLQGLAEVFESREYSLLVMPSRDPMKEAKGYESFVDGFIVYGPPQRQTLERLIHQHKSIITVDFDIDGYVSVNIDNYNSARECAVHALKNTVGDVAILGLRIVDSNYVCRIQQRELLRADSTITIQRLRGFLDAIEGAGMTMAAERIWHVPDNTHALGYQAAREALMCSPRPQLLLCMSDRIALAAMQAARHLDLKVPEDVRITGFDDIPESCTHHPSLTTVHQQSVGKGTIAAEIFLGQREEESVVVPTELVVRESCP